MSYSVTSPSLPSCVPNFFIAVTPIIFLADNSGIPDQHHQRLGKIPHHLTFGKYSERHSLHKWPNPPPIFPLNVFCCECSLFLAAHLSSWSTRTESASAYPASVLHFGKYNHIHCLLHHTNHPHELCTPTLYTAPTTPTHCVPLTF